MRLEPEIREILLKTAYVTLAIIVFFAVLGYFLKPQLEYAGTWVVATFGVWGIAIGCLLTDLLTLPIPPDAYLLAGVAAHTDPWVVIGAATGGSVVGGIGSYFIGRYFGTKAFAQRLVAPFKAKGTEYINKFGMGAVILAALTPLPFSILCILSGMMGMSFQRLLIAATFRLPRMAMFFVIIELGFNAY